MDTSRLQFSNNNQTNLINRFVLGVINTSLVLFLIYTISTLSYLPQSGTGVVMAIIAGLSIIYVSLNMFTSGVNFKNIKNMVNTVTMQDMTQDRQTILNKANKENFIFRMVNSAKLFYVSIISIALSILFFKYNDVIMKHHSTIPNFDTFFILIIMSIMSQTIYITSVHFTYIKEMVEKYLSVSYRSLLSFAILNFINLLFVIAMYSELQFMPTDG
jgi:hypothetical protein